jgi:hypothetical protein
VLVVVVAPLKELWGLACGEIDTLARGLSLCVRGNQWQGEETNQIRGQEQAVR